MVISIFDKIANRTRIGFLTAFVLLLISYVLTFFSTQKVIEQANGINHTNRIIHDLDNVLGFITRGESAFRGYVISDNKDLLNQYDQSIRSTDSTMKALKSFTADKPHYQQNLDTLQHLIEQKYQWMERLFSHFENTHSITPGFIADNEELTVKMKNIEQYVYTMQASERELWQQRSENVSQYSSFIKIFSIVSVVIALLLTLFSLLVFNKENREKKEQQLKTDVFREQLENRVEQLAELNKELIELRNLEKYAVTGRIARTIAHEVRNPLTNINLSIEQLRMDVPPSDNTQMFFDMVTRNSDRINALLSDLLNSTRVAELNFTSVDINEVVEESLVLAKDRLKLKQINIVKHYDHALAPVSVDVSKLTIAFLNIIVNAIEAMEENGTLTISTEKLNNRCVIKIADDGAGMTPAEVERLFEPYFTTKEKGNGLGLANTQNIIFGHGGSIRGESEKGRGTVFTIFLNFATPTVTK